jgi:hypothetical protein
VGAVKHLAYFWYNQDTGQPYQKIKESIEYKIVDTDIIVSTSDALGTDCSDGGEHVTLESYRRGSEDEHPFLFGIEISSVDCDDYTSIASIDLEEVATLLSEVKRSLHDRYSYNGPVELFSFCYGSC